MNAYAANTSSPLAFYELAATAILCCAAMAAPRLGAKFFARLEGLFAPLARRQWTSVITVGALAIGLRLCLLPWFPAPLPFVPDDFSFLLQADTFLHGRLTNPTPALWEHFETVHVSMLPTYQSMYFPAQALLLAAGKLLFGHPWFGVLLMSGLMCAAICWMLQAWLPPTWALLGGLLAVLRIGLFSYWINTYTGAAPICAFAGALLVGALPRLQRRPKRRYAMAMGVGAALLVISRPYEGLLLCLPLAVSLGWWLRKGKRRPRTVWEIFRLAAAPLLLICIAIAWLGYYDVRAFGKASTLPYTVNRNQYAVVPYYLWQKLKPEPVYRHEALRAFYTGVSPDIAAGAAKDNAYNSSGEMDGYVKTRGWGKIAHESLMKVIICLMFFAGGALLPPLFELRRILLDRRIRLLVVCTLVMAAGMSIEIFMIPHYVAAFTAIFYAIGLQAMRHLRHCRMDGAPLGQLLTRISITLCVVFAAARCLSGPLHLRVQPWPGSNWSLCWYGPDHYGVEREQLAQRLAALPGKQLAIVTYSPLRAAHDEWVYNLAEIDKEKVIWARDMGAARNQELLQHYGDRQAWLIDRSAEPAKVAPYPIQNAAAAAKR